MSKVALISDIHFGWGSGNEKFLQMQLNYFRNFFKKRLEENNVGTVIIAGDLFDNRKHMSLMVKNEVWKLFKEDLANFTIHIIAGNHDVVKRDTNEYNSIFFLNELPNVKTYIEPDDIVIDGKKFLLLPWVHEEFDVKSYVNQKLEIVKETGTKFDYLIAHLDLNGFALNKKVIYEHGTYNPSIFSSITHMLFTGHFHTRSSRVIDGTRFQYLGSPFAYDRSATGDLRGFAIVDVPSGVYEFIESDLIFRFHRIEYEDGVTKVRREEIENSYIDVYAKRTDTELPSFKSFMKELNECSPIKVYTFHIIEPVSKEISIDNIKIEFGKDSLGTTDMFDNYIKLLQIDEEKKLKLMDMIKVALENVA